MIRFCQEGYLGSNAISINPITTRQTLTLCMHIKRSSSNSNPSMIVRIIKQYQPPDKQIE